MKKISIIAVVLIIAMTATASALTYKTISALLISRNVNYNGNMSSQEFIVYNDTVYVPLRKFGNLTGISTDYKNGVINLKDDKAKIKKDDSSNIPPNGNYIGEARAKEIALQNAGLNESDVTFKKVKLDRDDRKVIYEIEFFGGGMEHEYEIDAVTGDIITHKQDTEDSNDLVKSDDKNIGVPNSTNNYIGNDKAQQIALDNAGLTRDQVSSFKIELESEDSGWEYKVEFKYGEKEYEYKINATTGSIIEKRIDD